LLKTGYKQVSHGSVALFLKTGLSAEAEMIAEMALIAGEAKLALFAPQL
jgi:hypothetical protein